MKKPTLPELNTAELSTSFARYQVVYQQLQQQKLQLDITRGKPSSEQLALSNELLASPGVDCYQDEQGTDCRNYGGLKGLRGLRAIFAELLDVPVENIIAGNNASLELMHNCISYSMLHGTPNSPRKWAAEPIVRFLCPSPGYDRHFALTEEMGFELIPIDMGPDGPDVEQVKTLVAQDPQIKGMWVVPTYSNPTGVTFTEQVARELASMPTAAPDFQLYWDNAYFVHSLVGQAPKPLNILEICDAAGHPNRTLIFASTSKITFAGSGVSFLASSAENLTWYERHLGKQTIGPDKINQLRHLQFFQDAEGVRTHMDRHRAILAPKFQLVHQILEEELGERGVATWTHPEGGYFISLDVFPGTARRVVDLAKAAGIVLTAAGSTYPYLLDPDDKNIRIAPSFPTLEELKVAMRAVTVCVLYAAAEALLNK